MKTYHLGSGGMRVLPQPVIPIEDSPDFGIVLKVSADVAPMPMQFTKPVGTSAAVFARLENGVCPNGCGPVRPVGKDMAECPVCSGMFWLSNPFAKAAERRAV